MKKYAWLILIYGAMPIHAADLSSALCPNPIPQPFTTTAHGSTQITASSDNYTIITWYTDASCATTSGASNFNGRGSMTLPGTGVFYICSGYSTTGNKALGPAGCGAPTTVGSMQLTQVHTDKGTFSVTGTCIRLNCNLDGTFNNWTYSSTNTISL